MKPTPYQRLAEVRTRTGMVVQLELLEELTGCLVDVDEVLIWTRCADYSTSGSTITVRRYGTKTRRIYRTPAGRWVYDAAEIDWDSDPIPVRIVSDRPATTAAERRHWEELCHRPGNANWPLDSHARTKQGY